MELSSWENILLALIVLGVILWMRPGINASMQRTRTAKPEWMSVLLPIAFVVMFVIFLIAMV